MSDAILHEQRGALAILTLNRPERANVLDDEMSAALIGAVARLAADMAAGTTRAVLLTANGKQFCAGGDIRGFVAAGDRLAANIASFLPAVHDAVLRLAALPVPVIAALNGPIGGGGIGLALSADVVLAAESMKLRGGYSAIGLTPDLGGSWHLARLAGPMVAKQVFFANRALTARECLAAGIVAEVHADAELPAAALALAGSLAAGATGSLGRIKALIDGAGGRSLADHLAAEYQSMVVSAGSAEAREGTAAFMEKRAPRY